MSNNMLENITDKLYRREEQNPLDGYVPQRGLLEGTLPTREEIEAKYDIIEKNTKGIEITSKTDETFLDTPRRKDLKDDSLHSVLSV